MACLIQYVEKRTQIIFGNYFIFPAQCLMFNCRLSHLCSGGKKLCNQCGVWGHLMQVAYDARPVFGRKCTTIQFAFRR